MARSQICARDPPRCGDMWETPRHMVISNQLPFLGLLPALRAFFTWRARRSWTRLGRAARTEPNFSSTLKR